MALPGLHSDMGVVLKASICQSLCVQVGCILWIYEFSITFGKQILGWSIDMEAMVIQWQAAMRGAGSLFLIQSMILLCCNIEAKVTQEQLELLQDSITRQQIISLWRCSWCEGLAYYFDGL